MKSFIKIIGPYSERALSNLLAYYFDKTADHGFKNLFVKSLLDLFINKGILFDVEEDQTEKDNYEVKQEVRTGNGKSIDILIKFRHPTRISKSWGIIIENKIKHQLYADIAARNS